MASDTIRHCPTCGREVAAARALCPTCLRRLDDVPVVAAPPAAPDAPAAPTPPRAALRRRGGRVGAALRRHPWRTAVATLVLVAVAWFAFARLRPAATLPRPSSTLSVAASAAAWPLPGGDLGATRATTAAPGALDSVAWRQHLDASITTAPVVDGDAVYVGRADDRLAALALADGAVRWDLALPAPVDSAPAVAGDALYLALRNGAVFALDRATGRQRWRAQVAVPVYATPVVFDGTVYVASFGHLSGIDAATGRVLWSTGIGGGWMQVEPVVAGNVIALATSRQVEFYDRRTGARTFVYPLREVTALVATPALVVAIAPHAVMAYEPSSRTPWWYGLRGAWANAYIWGMAHRPPRFPHLWGTPLESPQPVGVTTRPLPAASTASAFVPGADGSLTALDLATGAAGWTLPAGTAVAPPALTADGLLVAGSREIAVLDPRSGTVVRRSALPLARVSGLAVTSRGAVLIGGDGAGGGDATEVVLLR